MPAPPRVLVIVEDLPVPFDRRVWNEITALRAAGYEVSAVCRKGPGYEGAYEAVDGVHVYRHDLPVEADRPFDYFREYAYALWSELRLARRVRRERGFDVVHICNPPDLLFLVATWFKYLHGTAVIFDQHDVGPELYEAKFGRRDALYRVLRLSERLSFAVADVAIATNESYRSVAVGRGRKHPDDVFVVRNGPDLARFRRTAGGETPWRTRRHLVGYAGTMGHQEGIDYLLRAVRYLVRDLGRDDVSFVVIGGGTALEGSKALAGDLGVAEYVEFTGRIPDAALIARLGSCDLCVDPGPATPFNSMSTMNKILEYMALEKPIVQFDLLEGRRSAGEASLYAADNDFRDLARKMAELLDDPDRRARMGAEGRRRVEERLEWRHQVPGLLAAYERALTYRRKGLLSFLGRPRRARDAK